MYGSNERPLRLSDSLLNRLRIPNKEKEQFCLSIGGLVSSVFRQPEKRLRAGQIAGPLNRIADLSDRLAKALVAANEGQDKVAWAVKTRLEYELRYAPHRPKYLSHPQATDLLEVHRQIAEFLCSAGTRAAERASTNLEARGGKPGIRGHPGVLLLIGQLVTRILRAGGQITIENEADGKLIPLLEELRPFLPLSFIPERHPIPAYNRSIEKAIEEYYRLP